MNGSCLARNDTFRYVDRTGIRMMSFIRIPKSLLEEPLFQVISVEAVLLYSLLLDRLEISLTNDWFDEHGHAYVIYTLKEIQKVMRCGHDKAIRMLRELDTEHGIGLIERIRVGQGQPSIIYVKVYVPKTRTQEIGKTEFWNLEDQTSRSREERSLEVGKPESNKTDSNKNENNKTERTKNQHRHGAYHNVLLTEEELETLKREFPGDYEERIESLSEYMASTGKTYKNHLATIRSWSRRERKQQSMEYRRENYETEDTL